MLIDI
jgi:hypothetical protein